MPEEKRPVAIPHVNPVYFVMTPYPARAAGDNSDATTFFYEPGTYIKIQFFAAAYVWRKMRYYPGYLHDLIQKCLPSGVRSFFHFFESPVHLGDLMFIDEVIAAPYD